MSAGSERNDAEFRQIQAELTQFFQQEWDQGTVQLVFAADCISANETGKYLLNAALAMYATEGGHSEVEGFVSRHSCASSCPHAMGHMITLYHALKGPGMLPLSVRRLQDKFFRLFYFNVKLANGHMAGLLTAIGRLHESGLIQTLSPGQTTSPSHSQVPPCERPELPVPGFRPPPADLPCKREAVDQSSLSDAESVFNAQLAEEITRGVPRNCPAFQPGMNYKGVLNEYTQKNGLNLPLYETRRKMGEGIPDHAPRFNSTVKVSNPASREVLRASALGRNKKEAEFRAAYKLIMTRMADDIVS
ncbi:Double-stranded RNA binding motif [Carpediemonas membranifera]|uniref:Double-stranded RNA binding motif n=1 Tax=Carpediemonas membranifera TaxID=201153 RepID=A0A8J6AX80_9EUKA|nr:Double-stranded RNA binding motif [Carpediemonas membranifera]|eukprot:KAG9390588.1 Double-stranded RNA binding motif [Carpediemonas membranifera]